MYILPSPTNHVNVATPVIPSTNLPRICKFLFEFEEYFCSRIKGSMLGTGDAQSVIECHHPTYFDVLKSAGIWRHVYIRIDRFSGLR